MHTLLIFLGALVLAVVFWSMYLGRQAPRQAQRYGVSFSSKEAVALGLSADEAYTAMLDDLQVRRLRLAAYWDVIEPEQNVYDFSGLDWQLNEAERRGTAVLLAVGRKLPRWPECFIPAWAQALSVREQHTELLAMLWTVVERYRNHPAVAGWQLENEPFVWWFGHCPAPDPSLLQAEQNLVRSLTNKPIVITDSGELSSWRRAIGFGDAFGTTIYRVTWNYWLGYGYYPLPPGYYRFKARLWGVDPADVLITELQAEPWTPGRSMVEVPLAEQFRAMDLQRFQDNLLFARQTGFGDVYLWGAEWWYWLKEKQGHPEFWEAARKLFQP